MSYDTFQVRDEGKDKTTRDINPETIGEDEPTKNQIVEKLRTENIGVSAEQSQDLSVDTGEANAERLAIDDVSDPNFDDFDELDATAHEVVVDFGSHHHVEANAKLEAASGSGQVHLIIYLNDVEIASADGAISSGEDVTAYAGRHLKLSVGDVIHAEVWHSTSGAETFPGDSDSNYLSCVRQ